MESPPNMPWGWIFYYVPSNHRFLGMNKHFNFPYIYIYIFQINRIHFPFYFWSILENLLTIIFIFPMFFWTFKPLWLLICQMPSQPNKCSQIRTSILGISRMTKMKEQKKKMGMLTRLKMTRLDNKPRVKKNTRVENIKLYICWTKGCWENTVW